MLFALTINMASTILTHNKGEFYRAGIYHHTSFIIMRFSSITIFLPFILASTGAIPTPGTEITPAPVILARTSRCSDFDYQLCDKIVLDLWP